MNPKIQHKLVIPADLSGLRLDQALAKLLPDYSRALLQKWIKAGAITLNGHTVRAKDLVFGDEEVELEATLEAKTQWEPEALALDIIYEDEDLLVINKPIGLVVHPGTGNTSKTMLNALLYHCPSLQHLPRAGIIHRLDKDTSGLLVIAKTIPAFTSLTQQLKERSISRIYQAVVNGVLISGGTVNAPIARHPLQRQRMAVIETGKPAITHYRVLERFRAHTRLKLQLETGRTHQIRVHMAHVKHPIVGDLTYGGRLKLPKGASEGLVEMLRQFKRQALHAAELGFIHPTTLETVSWQVDPPEDMQALVRCLRQDLKTSEGKK